MGSKFTTKLLAIKTVLFSKSFMIIYHKNGIYNAMGAGSGPLEETFLLALAIKKAYEDMVVNIEHAAVESGELQDLLAMKKVAEMVENGQAK